MKTTDSLLVLGTLIPLSAWRCSAFRVSPHAAAASHLRRQSAAAPRSMLPQAGRDACSSRRGAPRALSRPRSTALCSTKEKTYASTSWATEEEGESNDDAGRTTTLDPPRGQRARDGERDGRNHRSQQLRRPSVLSSEGKGVHRHAGEREREQRRLADMSQPPRELMLGIPASQEAKRGQRVGGEDRKGGSESSEAGAGVWASRAMLAGAAALYGTNFGCVKLLEETVPMSLAAALRFSVAMIPFLPFLRNLQPGVFRAGCEIGALNFLGYWAQSESLMTTSASKSAFICSLAVVLVPVLDTIFGAVGGETEGQMAERKAAKKAGGGLFATMNGPWFPALLAAAGVACLELVGSDARPSLGDLWALLQPLCFGLGFWRTERLSRRFPGDTFSLVAVQLLTIAAMAVGWCVGANEVPQSLATLKDVVLPASGSLMVPLSLLWTGLVTTSLTVYGETTAMKQVSAAESTVILSTEPLWGTAFAAILLGETVGWNTAVGATLVLAACTWASVGTALQSKLLSMIAATGAAGAAAESMNLDLESLDLDLDLDGDIIGRLIQYFLEDRS